MALKPENPVVAGTTLRRESIRSPNFVAGVSGWKIAQDGSAEFNNLTIRGTFKGTDFEINSLGAFFYSGPPAAGNLIASIAPAAGANDGHGNAFKTDLATYGIGGSYTNLHDNELDIGANATDNFPSSLKGGGGDLLVSSGQGSALDTAMGITMLSKALSFSGNTPQLCLASGTPNPATAAMLELQGSQAIRPAAGATITPLSIIGSTAAGQLAYFEQDGNTDHAITANQTGTGATQAAINAVSSNPNFTTVEITGTETGRGTLKITHQGYAAGSDANAAAISIDLQTTVGGATGTNAQGIFITSTTDTIPGGNALTIRYAGLDYFVVKGFNSGAGQGTVGIGVPIGHIPAGMLEITQKDSFVPGLFMQAVTPGADMVQIKDSAGTLRFQIGNAGNAFMRAAAFVSTNLQIGAVSADFGGGGSVISIKHTTDPTTNPTGGCIIYVDAAGNLLARTSAGNVRTIAAV